MKPPVVLSLISTYFCGLVFGLLVTQKAITIPFPNTSERWYLEWILTNAAFLDPARHDQIHIFDPTLGWTLKPNLPASDYFGSLVHSNSDGIRGTKKYIRGKSDMLRVITIGDSFTFGACVSDNETFSSYLEQLLPNAEVLNMGTSGYGIDQILLKLQTHGTPFQPDIVILGFFDDDLFRNTLWFREYFKPKFVKTAHGYAPINLPLPDPNHSYPNVWEMAQIIFKSNMDMTRVVFRGRGKETQEDRDRNNWLIREIIKTSQSMGATPYLLYIPTRLNLHEKSTFHADPYPQICSEGNIHCIDPTDAMLKYAAAHKEIKNLFACHFKPEIHEVIARVINDLLIHDGYGR